MVENYNSRAVKYQLSVCSTLNRYVRTERTNLDFRSNVEEGKISWDEMMGNSSSFILHIVNNIHNQGRINFLLKEKEEKRKEKTYKNIDLTT